MTGSELNLLFMLSAVVARLSIGERVDQKLLAAMLEAGDKVMAEIQPQIESQIAEMALSG